MRADVFGKAVPLDPLAGDPYMWARKATSSGGTPCS